MAEVSKNFGHLFSAVDLFRGYPRATSQQTTWLEGLGYQNAHCQFDETNTDFDPKALAE
jgi:hypothetical protein